MIDEEATFKKFGYYPSALKPHSNKHILAACDECGKVRKNSMNQYRSLCGPCSRKGKTNWLGRKHTKEARESMSAAHKGENHPNYGKRGEEAFKYKGGKTASHRRQAIKRGLLGYKLLMPLKDGEAGHHVTDEYVIGIPKEVHISMGGRRRKHRTLVLQWLKANDKKKYLKVLCVLAEQ